MVEYSVQNVFVISNKLKTLQLEHFNDLKCANIVTFNHKEFQNPFRIFKILKNS